MGEMAANKTGILCAMLTMLLVKPVTCGTYAQDFITLKTWEMNTLVKKASENDANMCELLAKCDSTLEACSREACKPSLEEVVGTAMSPAFNFVRVANNTDCPGEDSSNNTCHYMVFNFNQSYVMYIASTTVPKAVMVIIDIGKSMMNKDKFGREVFLETAKTAARELLHSLAPGDFVNIIAFNSVTAAQFVSAPVMVQDHHNNDHQFPEYIELKAKLDELKADQVHFEASNITSAIDIALQNFDRINRPDILKATIVLTDGAFAGANVRLPTTAMVAAKTKLFLYAVSPESRELTASFTSQLPTIGGSFINIYRDVKNPLYTMEPFYSFTAMLHQRLMHPLADFTYKLEEFSRFNKTMLVASKPGFRADGSLIGVAGISIYLQMVENSIEEIKAIVREQQDGRHFDARSMVTLGPANCTIQVEPKSVYVCGRNTTLPPNRGFCVARNFGTSIQNRGCLHPTCALKPPTEPPNLALICGVSVAAGMVLVAAATVFVIYIYMP